MKRLREYWDDLDVEIMVNRRELTLGLSLCVTAGILLGMIFSPRKQVAIGSNNHDNGCNNSADPKT